MARQRPASFEDRLTLVEHLDELRTRIVISISAFAVAATLCFWQNGMLLEIANAPLPGDRTPSTFGVAEPFTTTLTITLYAAIVISLPVILYERIPVVAAQKEHFVQSFDYVTVGGGTAGRVPVHPRTRGRTHHHLLPDAQPHHRQAGRHRSQALAEVES
jgi:hypothetical protein